MAYQISIHALREEGDLRRYCKKTKREQISIHALREEGDNSAMLFIQNKFNFYPRPPRGGRRKTPKQEKSTKVISIHALREEGDLRSGAQLIYQPISIHALREEGDRQAGSYVSRPG